MADECSVLSGTVETDLPLLELAARLRAHGQRVQIRDSDHYQGGRYLQLGDGSVHFTFESTASETLAAGNADSVAALRKVAAEVSRTLSDLRIRHRFEIYDDHDEMAEYLHHRWPQPAAPG